MSHVLEITVPASPSTRFTHDLRELAVANADDLPSRILVRTEEVELTPEDTAWMSAKDISGIRICDSGAPLSTWDELPPGLAVRISNLTNSSPISFPAAILGDRGAVIQPLDLLTILAEAIDAGETVETRGVSRIPQWRVSLAPSVPSARTHLPLAVIESLAPPVSSLSRDQAIAWDCVMAGLLQMNDYLDHSHEYSQSIEGQGPHVTGDYWHGIMHRREPDFGNSGYWFRRVGYHPVFDELATVAATILTQHTARPEATGVIKGGHWSSMAMIDLCRSAVTTRDPELTAIAEDLQWAEMLLLLRFSWREFDAG